LEKGEETKEPLKDGEEKKEESEYEDEDEAYGEEDYDQEGKYIWGKEGDEWQWHNKEDKEAYERGDRSVHPENVLNPAMMRPTIED
jgi:hypothetical protein